jgi:phosphonate transport system substrate-binding protein
VALALAQGTVDVAANWWNADDDSNLTRMLNKGMLKNPDGSPMKKEDFRIILKSGLIINSPTAMLSGLPEELKSAIRTAFLEAAAKDKAAFARLSDGKNQPFQPIDTSQSSNVRTGTLRLIAADRRRVAVPACRRISRNARSIVAALMFSNLVRTSGTS